MAQITDQVIHAAYEVAKKIHAGYISHKEGLDILENEHGMNRNSAADYVHNYACMAEGRRFTRTLNNYATEYYLKRLYEDGGRARLLSGLSALRQHLDYYEAIGETTLHTARSIYDRFFVIAAIESSAVYPDEVSKDEDFLEGKAKQVFVNVYERNPVARQQCIDHYGCACVVCGFDFEKTYGVLGKSYIHVHHLVEISSIGSEYSISPINDLRPVCPNCHAMIHRNKPAYSIEEVKNCVRTAR